jgi:hypothetical protein
MRVCVTLSVKALRVTRAGELNEVEKAATIEA